MVNSSKHSSGWYSTVRKTLLIFSYSMNWITVTKTLHINHICILCNWKCKWHRERNGRTEMRIRSGQTGTLHRRFYRPRLYETIAVLFWTSGAGTVTVKQVIRVLEHVVVAESCFLHWPVEYPITSPSPHSLNTWYGNRTGSWVGESCGKINACNANDKPQSWEHHPPAGSVARFTRGRVRELKNAQNSVTVQNRTHVCMNYFDHKDLGNHLLQ